MNRSRLPLCVGLAAMGLAQPARAQDDQAPLPPPAPYVMQLSPEEVGPPVPSRIVAARGVVMAETAAERAERKRLYASMLKSIVPAAARAPKTTPTPAPH